MIFHCDSRIASAAALFSFIQLQVVAVRFSFDYFYHDESSSLSLPFVRSFSQYPRFLFFAHRSFEFSLITKIEEVIRENTHVHLDEILTMWMKSMKVLEDRQVKERCFQFG